MISIRSITGSGILALALLAPTTFAAQGTFRVVEYNLDADTGVNQFDSTAGIPPSNYLSTVLQAIGNQQLGPTGSKNAQPIDVLALTELSGTKNSKGYSITLDAVVSDLNAIYGANTYAYDPHVFSNSTGTGNGPSGLIYNTKTVSVAGVTGIGTPNSDGEARVPVRYQLQPLGYGSGASFYLYVEHAKADSGITEAGRRANEALLVRQDADALPANSHIIYSGDFNMAGSTSSNSTSGSAEPAYKNFTAAPGATLYSADTNNTSTLTLNSAGTGGSGRANDVLATSFQASSSTAANVKLYTESATSLSARFDMQLISDAMLSTSPQIGMHIVPESQIALGSDYYDSTNTLKSTNTYHGDVSDSTNTGPQLSSSILTALDNTTDHLPIISDYQIVGMSPIPEPAATLSLAGLAALLIRRRRKV